MLKTDTEVGVHGGYKHKQVEIVAMELFANSW